MSTWSLWLLLFSLVLIPTIALIIPFSLVVQKVLFFFIYWSLDLHSFFSVMPCGFYTYVHLIPVTFPEKFLWSLMLVLNLGVLLLWIPVCISKIIKQNLWTLRCKYSFFYCDIGEDKEKKVELFYFDDLLRNKGEI